jgi:ABC-type uncharacterized transport system auxiliary subunit
MKALALLVLASCALISKQPPLEVHYFSPELRAPPASVARAAPSIDLQLGRIVASDYLRALIVHRNSAVELDRYEALRWTEMPDAYVERALARALFESARPFAQVVGGSGPTLDVEVIAFEEVRSAGRTAGRVELRYRLHDDRVVIDRGVVTAERDARGSQIELVVAAIGEALESATADVADRVTARLAAPRACTACARSTVQR